MATLAWQLGASRVYRGVESRLLSQDGRRGGCSASGRRSTTTTAKIHTNDGRRKAAELMGLSAEDASDETTLKRAFRRACLRYHPDITRDKTGKKFKEVQDAYRILSLNSSSTEQLPEQPDDQEWSTHDWRWAHRYTGSGAPGVDAEAMARKVSEEERQAKIAEQLKSMAAAPARRKRRIIQPLSTTPTPQPTGVTFINSAVEAAVAVNDEEADEEMEEEEVKKEVKKVVAGDGTGLNWTGEEGASSEPTPWDTPAAQARRVRGAQSDRHSTDKAHELLNAQLQGLHRKKIIRARYMGEDPNEEAVEEETSSSGRHRGGVEDEHEIGLGHSASRFYGGTGLQLEDSTPERFVRLAKLAKEWRESKTNGFDAQYDAIYASYARDRTKPSAKEMLQAAVEGVALGACT